jgi:hypothetical protein
VRTGGAQEISCAREKIFGREQEAGREVIPRGLTWVSRLVLAGALVIALVFAASASASEAIPAPKVPHWELETRAAPTSLPLKGQGGIAITAANIGDEGAFASKTSPIRIKDTLPKGTEVEPTAKIKGANLFGGTYRFTLQGGGAEFGCTHAVTAGRTVVECTMGDVVEPFETMYILIPVKTEYAEPPAKAPSGTEIENVLELQEGQEAGKSTPTPVVSTKMLSFGGETKFGVEEPVGEGEPRGFRITPENDEFKPDELAGSHPFQLTTTVNFNQTFARGSNGANAEKLPTGLALPKDLNFKLPAGLIGNATSLHQCTDAQFSTKFKNNVNSCPEDTAIGVADVTVNNPNPSTFEFVTLAVPVFNLEPGPGEPARFGFESFSVPVILNTSVRTGEDYGATVSVVNASSDVEVLGSRVTIWGTPADPRHDSARGWACLGKGTDEPGEIQPPPKCGGETPNENAFLTLPTACGTQSASMSGNTWDGTTLPTPPPSEFSLEGCGELPFNPSITVTPDKETASTPSGLTVEVKVPQEESTLLESKRAEADIKSTTLTLPEGLETSAGAANYLQTCSVQQAGFAGQNTDTGSALGSDLEKQGFSFLAPLPREQGLESACPQESKIGKVKIKTPFLADPLEGSLYLAVQDTDPFSTPLVLYLIAEEPESKVLVKLAGEVKIEANGQLVSTFKNTPQAAFEKLTLELFNGSKSGAETAAQATPAFCGSYEAKANFKTWSEAPGQPEPEENSGSSFAITSGPHGGACTQKGEKLPFAPSFQAGSTNPEAAKYSPFTLTIARPDGSQALKSIDMELPPGLAAKLGSVPLCGAQAAEEGTCGEESKIGESITYSGLGNAPVSLAGKVYLTGPYDGAPFGLSTVTDATKVGPFNIGRIVVRSAINVNETTAAANINTNKTNVYRSTGQIEHYEGLPEFIEGLPAQIKQLNVNVNRPEFEFNPTSCTPMSVTGTLAGYEGTNVPVSSPFQASNCASLAFAPKLTASVVGQGSKTEGTTFAVKIEFPSAGQANIHKVDLTIPSKLPSRLTTIQKACLEAVFNANPASCDEGSVIGEGVVHTPVFKNPLRGPAYLVSHGGAAFPDVEFVLQGEGVKIVVDGKTFIHEGITYSKFETSPDAPFSTFETVFPKGPHSALTPSVPEKENFNLCKQTLTIPTEITGQNGAFIKQTTPVVITGCKGVEAFITGKAKIKKHSVKGSTLKLVVFVPSGGHITVSGSGLRTLKKSVSKAGTYTLEVKLGPKGKTAVATKHLLKVHVKLGFQPTHGRASSAPVSATFH